MKRFTLTICAAAVIFTACNNEKTADSNKTSTDSLGKSAPTTMAANPCEGYDPSKDSAANAAMDTAMMNKWMEFATPGDMHSFLAKDNGEWSGDVTTWMDPKAPSTTSKMKATYSMIMGGRYQKSENTGCFGGMPFEGMSISGYDNGKKKFYSTWIDNMGTGFMNMEGTYDAANKTISMTGTCTDPMTGKTMKVREILTFVDDNTRKMEMFGPDATGKEFKTMEIIMKRKV